jgi:hypothetical protein
MNDLVVTASAPSVKDCAEGLRMIGPGIVARDGIENRNWLAVGLAGASGVTDAVDFVVDPIASMAASAASFLMEYVEPLREALDSLAGSPSAVGAQAQTWERIAQRVVQTAGDYSSRTATALTGWEGPAASAYRSFVASYTELLDGTGKLCSGISSAMVGASAVVGFVRTIVRETIADLVGKLVSWASQVAATAGVGATWVVPQAVRSIAVYVEKVRGWITDLTSSIRTLCRNVSSLNDSLDHVVPVIGRISDKVDVPMFSPVGTRTLNREMPNVNDLIPTGFTTYTNGANSGMLTGIKASQEPE